MSSFFSTTTLLIGAAALSGSALGQSFNIDFGDPFSFAGTPSATYGGAAGNPGEWNAVNTTLILTSPYTAPALVDTSGAATGVTVTFEEPANGNAPFSLAFDEPNTTGDDQALMDDIYYYGVFNTVTISGLADGNYSIYSYAMAPDSAAFLTNVNVPGSPDPPQDVGGSFSAGHALGVTHAMHTFTVSGGGDIVVEFVETASFDSMNGMQIVSTGGGGNMTLACDPANNHSGGGYVSLGQSSFSGPGAVHLEATGGIDGEFGYFLVSAILVDPGTSVANGMLCLGAPIGRYAPAAGGALNSVGSFDASGTLQNIAGTSSVGSGYDVLPTLPSPPGGMIMSGDTYYFQCWYRDGQRSNFSNALCVTF